MADKLARFKAVLGEALLGIETSPNLDVESEEPSGLTLYVNPEAKVDVDIVSDSLGQVLAVAPILAGPYQEKELTDDFFSRQREVIQRSVPQFSEAPATLFASSKDPRDVSPWTAELGGRGAFVGVYSQMSSDHLSKEFYVVARGTAPEAVRDLKSKLAEKPMTYRALAESTELAQVEQLAYRNVTRNMASVAEACRCLLSRSEDVQSALVNLNMGAPELAAPKWSQQLYSMRLTRWEDKPAVALYCGVVPTSNAVSSDLHYVVRSPIQGLYSFPITQEARSEAIPADSGPLQAEESSVRANIGGLVWEGKSAPRVAGAAVAQELEIKTAMKSGGWNPEEHVGVLVQVTTKVYNDQIRRPKKQ
jgi:hypothetical protein